MTNDGLWNMVVSLVEVWNMWIKSWTNVVYAMNHWGFAFHEFNDGMIWCDNNRRIFNGNNGMMPECRKICETDLWALEQSFGDPLDPFRFCWLHHFWLRKTWYCNCSLVIEAAHFQSTNPIWDERWDIYIYIIDIFGCHKSPWSADIFPLGIYNLYLPGFPKSNLPAAEVGWTVAIPRCGGGMCKCPLGGVLSHGGTPSYHPFLF